MSSIRSVVQSALNEEIISIAVKFLHSVPSEMNAINIESQNPANLEEFFNRIKELKTNLVSFKDIKEKELAEVWTIVKGHYDFKETVKILNQIPWFIIELDMLKKKIDHKNILEDSIVNVIKRTWDESENSADITLQLILSIPYRIQNLQNEARKVASGNMCLKKIDEMKSYLETLKDVDHNQLDELCEETGNKYDANQVKNIVDDVNKTIDALETLEAKVRVRLHTKLINTLFTTDPSEPRGAATKYNLRK